MESGLADGIEIEGLNLWYGKKHALKDIDLYIAPKNVTAIIGPSGCGKSTLLRCFNRMNDLINGCMTEGRILFHEEDICEKGTDLIDLRRRIGMVFQRPTPFPLSVYDNVVYGLRMGGVRSKRLLGDVYKRSMEASGLYSELEERHLEMATNLSGGQQQRLCIARALAMEPEVLLFDEPCSALDPIATARIERTIQNISKDVTVIIVTHNLQQAKRISDRTVFMLDGEMIECGETDTIFNEPEMERTKAYVEGMFG